MTNPTPHGQVPEALIDLIDTYAETRHRCGCAAYNAQTAEARQRVTDYIESIGAGGMQSLRAPDVVALADVLRKLDDTLGPGNVATTALSRHFSTGTSVEQAPAAINSGVEIIIDFSQVGTAGPFPVVDGRVSLPDATMLDLVHMLRPTYEAQAQQAAPQQEAQEPAVDDPTRWFTVVYRDISPGDEARLLGEHPKASAMSWSHAIRDRDAARAVLAKWGTQPQAGAVPQGWKAVPVNPTPEMWKAAKSVPDPNPPYPPHYGLVWDAMLAATPTPQALSAGPMVASEQRRLIGVIADKIEDGTLFQSGIYPKKDLARFVRNMLDTTPTAPAASPTPPAEQPIGEVVVTKDEDGQIVAVTRQDDEGRILSVIATSDPAKQQTQPGAIYAELHEPDATTVGLGAVWNRHSMRDFADRTHALRQAVIAPELQAEARRRYDAAMEQAATKAAPQQEAQEPVAWLNPWRADQVTTDYDAYGERGIPLYTAPQPSPTAQSADSVPAISDLPPLPDIDLRDVGTKPQDVKDFLNGYATEYARLALAARAPAGSVPVAWLRNTTDPQPHAVTNLKYRSAVDAKAGVEYIPAFAAHQPVEREPLTDAQIAEMMRDTWGCASIAPRHALEFARAVERAHGITKERCPEGAQLGRKT